MIGDFVPYEKEPTYKIVVSRDEALFIQRMRSISYGSISAHIVASKIIRTETTDSEKTEDWKRESVKIAIEVIENGI